MDMDPYTEGLQATRQIAIVKPRRRTRERVRVPALEGGSTIHQFKAVFEARRRRGAATQPGGPAQRRGSLQRARRAGAATPQGRHAHRQQHRRGLHLRQGQGTILYIDNVEGGRGADARRGAAARKGSTSSGVSVDQFPNSRHRAAELRLRHPGQRPARRGRHQRRAAEDARQPTSTTWAAGW